MTRADVWPSFAALGHRTIDELVDVYAQAAVASDEMFPASEQNAAADCVANVYRELRRRGIEAQRRLLAFIEDERPGVRGWAASHALEFEPALGESALSIMATEGTLTGFSAATTLNEWRNGRLRFP